MEDFIQSIQLTLRHKHYFLKFYKSIYLFILFMTGISCNMPVFAQATLPTAPIKDTSSNKTNTSSWKNPEANINYKKLNSEIVYKPDTSIHTFQRRPFSQPWYRDLGNVGSPVQNLLFTPEDRVGPTLGYHVFDVYRFNVDDLNFYNTTKPYTAFTFQLGSKLEQMANIFHTQNIKPNWNFSFEYRKITSPGFYNIQRTNHDNLCLSTNYKSKNQHYSIFAGLVYNKQQQDENGGIINDRELDSADFTNRKTLDVRFANAGYSTTRSSVSNMQRDMTFLFQHSYTWGLADTTYSSDSTKYTATLIPRFRITHKFEFSTEKYQYKDVAPDSERYTSLFQQGFNNTAPDSVFTQQKWVRADNRILLNGFVGKPGKLLEFNAGIGNRFDGFLTNYDVGFSRTNIISNYIIGELKKEAINPGQWLYQANAQLYLTGDAAGDFLLNIFAGKDLNNNKGDVVVGFKQQLNSAPYNYLLYQDQYFKDTNGYSKESISQLYTTIQMPGIRTSLGARVYAISNYIFLDSEKFSQYAPTVSIAQVWVRKVFKIRNLFIDNEITYQQIPGNAPVNIPTLLGRHQFSFEKGLFKNALRIATGLEIRYHSGYYCAGYDPFFNRFFYQHSYYLSNTPEASVFFNFRIKRFRAYLMGDQLQQLFTRNTITAPGYPAQNAMLRFGFTWVMIN